MTALEFLSKLLVEEFNVEPSEIVPEATPAGLGLDSLSTAEFVRELEDEFGIKFSAEQAVFNSLGEAAAIAEELIRTSQG